MYRSSLEHPNFSNTKTSGVSLVVQTLRLDVAGLVAKTGNNDVLHRFRIRDDIVLLRFCTGVA